MPSSASFLGPIGLISYAEEFDAVGADEPSAVADMSVNDLVDALGMTKYHAVRLRNWLDTRCVIYLSGRPAAFDNMAYVRGGLEERGIEVLPRRSGGVHDVTASAADGIERCDLFVCFGSYAYGNVAEHPSSSREFECARRTRKPIALLRMCDRLDSGAARAFFDDERSTAYARAFHESSECIDWILGHALAHRLEVHIVRPATSEWTHSGYTVEKMLQGEQVWNTEPIARGRIASVVVGVGGRCRVTGIELASTDGGCQLSVEEVLDGDDVGSDGGERSCDESTGGSAATRTERCVANGAGRVLVARGIFGNYNGGGPHLPRKYSARTLKIATHATRFRITVMHDRAGGTYSAGVAIFRMHGIGP